MEDDDRDDTVGPTLADKPGAVSRPNRPEPRPSRYRSGTEIARGGMGRVVEATDTLLGRTVAVKEVLTLNPELLRRFARETRITARLEHPSIVPVYDAGVDGDAPFYVMRRVSGQPLTDLIAKAPGLEERLALIPHVLAAAQAVAHAHQRDIVHRDIKPANILVGELGETVVIDWGLAKVLDEDDDDDPIAQAPSAGDSLQTRAGVVIGTPGFMSPEQIEGKAIGKPADVYALGATLYCVLAGKPPHHANNGDAMMALASQGPPRPLAELVPGVPRELSTIVETALAFGSTSYPDAGAFAEELRRFSTGQLVASHRYSRRERLVRFVRLHRAAVAIGLVAVVVLAVGATLSIQRILAERDRADDEATAAAVAGQRERQRADQLLLLRAATQVATNPTEAVAMLKELDPNTPRVAEAHAIVDSAELQGTAWAMPGPLDFTPLIELDAATNRLLQVTWSGELRVWDLVQRRALWAKPIGKRARATWIGDRILVYGDVETAFVDAATGAMTTTTLPRLEAVSVSEDAGSILAIGERETFRLELSPTPHLISLLDHKATSIAQPADGSWYAIADDKELVIVDRTGTVIGKRAGRPRLIRASESQHLAVLDGDQLLEAEIKRPLTWRSIDYQRFSKLFAMMQYRNERLLVGVATNQYLVDYGQGLIEIARPRQNVTFPVPINNGDLIGLTGERSLIYFSHSGTREIGLPASLRDARLTARRSGRRAVIVAAGVIVTLELEHAAPSRVRLGKGIKALPVDETTLLVFGSNWQAEAWYDLATRTRTEVEFEPLSRIELADRDPVTRRAALRTFDGQVFKIFVIAAGERQPTMVYSGDDLSIPRLIPGGVLVGNGNKVVVVERGQPRVLATMSAQVDSVIRRGSAGFAALTTTGELVRGLLAGGSLETIIAPSYLTAADRRAAPLDPKWSSIGADGAGRIYFASDRRLVQWTDHLETVLERAEDLSSIEIAGSHALVRLASGDLIVDLETRTTHLLPPRFRAAELSLDGTRVLFELDGSYHVIDTSTFAISHTSIPSEVDDVAISPAGTMLTGHREFEQLSWRIPTRRGPLRTRLDEVTNARVREDGSLRWPWQTD